MPFQASAAELLLAGTAVQPEKPADAVVLVETVEFAIDTTGRETVTRHLIYRVLTDQGVENWASVSEWWSPWHQSKPTITARVVTPDGVEHRLDPATLSEAPAREEVKVYSDGKVLHGPLPAVAVGAVVEQLTVERDTAPYFPGGLVHTYTFGRYVPVQLTRLRVKLPSNMPFHSVKYLLPELKEKKSDKGGFTTWDFENGPMKPLEDAEGNLPSDQPRYPLVGFSFAASWHDLAERYAREVDARIQPGGLANLTAEWKRTATDRAAKIAVAYHYATDEIRYTGVELGEASMIPREPAETLRRQYGDCKDKSVLLVALLRELGIEAYPALLVSGMGRDSDPELPGVGRFNHAIVYVPGEGGGTWLDPTADLSRSGVLPNADEGRLALIVKPGTTGLSRIPESKSSANRVVENREFLLAIKGPAQVTETSQTYGISETAYREAYAQRDAEENKKSLKDYAEYNYAAKELTKVSTSPAKDFNKPFELKLEIKDAKRGPSDGSGAAVGIFTGSMMDRFPSDLLNLAKDDNESDDKDSKKDEKPTPKRKGDFVLPFAFQVEWNYRIVPADGYQLRSLPDGGEEKFGPAVLTTAYHKQDDGVVTVKVTLDSVKRRYTAEEALALADAVHKLKKGTMPLVLFDQTGAKLLSEGKIREALAEYRRLSEAHPKETLFPTQISRALLAAGAGEEARKQARRAVELSPDSADAYENLGEILQFDLVGRKFRKGCDTPGAVTALRKAIELDPANKRLRVNLPIYLEYNQDGQRYGDGAPLEEAIKAYLAAKDDIPSFNMEQNPVYTYLNAGRYAEARDYALQLKTKSDSITMARLIAVAAADGGDAALRLASTELAANQNRSQLLAQAAQTLMNLRLYPASASLYLAAAQSGGTNGAALQLANALKTVKRVEDVQLAADDPTAPAVKFFARGQNATFQKTELPNLVSRYYDRATLLKDVQLDSVESRRAVAQVSRSGLTWPVAADLGYARTQVSKEGDDAFGYRVTFKIPTAGGQYQESNLFVTKEDGIYRLLGGVASLQAMGRFLSDQMQQGQTELVQKWLVRLAACDKDSDATKSPTFLAFAAFWGNVDKPKQREIRAAVALLLAEKADAEKSFAILNEVRGSIKPDIARRVVDLSLVDRLIRLKRYSEAAAFLHKHEGKPSPENPYTTTQIDVYRGMGNFDEINRLGDSLLKQKPDNDDLIRALVSAAEQQGDAQRVRDLHAKLVALNKVTPTDLNNLTWAALFDGKIDDTTFQMIEKANLDTQHSSYPILHTAASLYAEVGKTSEALAAIVQAMDANADPEPNPGCWYVFGRVAEQLGIPEAAIADYQRALTEDEGGNHAFTTASLARRRLAVLKPAKPEAGKRCVRSAPRGSLSKL